MNKNKKGFLTSTVISSIEELQKQAEKAFISGNKERSSKYIQMILDLIKKNKVTLPQNLKNTFCKKCASIWVIDSPNSEDAHKHNVNTKILFDKKHNLFRAICQCGAKKIIS